MLEKSSHTSSQASCGPQLREALDQIGQIVLDGLSHGHFRATVSSAVGKSPGAPIGNDHARKHGHYTADAIAERRELATLIRSMRGLIEEVDG